ncbi:MAG TPA: selenocysteine-specific translation elongation factor [Ktedonobacteraceae bacterium]|nr:selenocysteine-specific translation elongation factor [Ktedonobacteraceae bacterium]
MSCIGTAGHVDHGKSTLVKVLTGIDPDRLTEEKERGMTIDLGFAWLKLPSGREVSIVDVPGHENFIKNMLAGVGGIDIALLVVAADEGIMPQTREHLAILDLLQVSRGVVVLTKADLVDEEWLEMVREEVEDCLRPTTLAGATILPVSAYTRQGLPELLAELDRLLESTRGRKNNARPRLSIDRVFSLTGFGTVVTGTLLDGVFNVGQEVEIVPQAVKTRVRGLQMHKQQIETAQPGNRVAINLANIAKSDLERGNVVALPGQMHPTLLVDAHIRLLADVARPLAHNTLVDFYSGSQVIPARVRLLDVEELLPGKEAWAQLRLQHPAVVARLDHCILRLPSPSTTIGGGTIVDVQPRYHRRFQHAPIEALERLAHGLPDELILAALDRRPALRRTTKGKAAEAAGVHIHGLIGYEGVALAQYCHLAENVTQEALETLLTEGKVVRIGAFWFAQPVWEELVREALRLVQDYHRSYPLRRGLPKEEWRARLGLPPRMAADIFARLQAEGLLDTASESVAETTIRSGLVRAAHFSPQFTAKQQKQVTQVLDLFLANLYMPPSRAEIEAIAGPEVVNALLEQGQLMKLADGTLFLPSAYNEAVERLVAYMSEHGSMTVAEARDILGTTRKYIVPLLEHMDAQRLTRRSGDVRMPGATQRA